ncbi:hypothetical protein BSZ39_07040 [Bowdeniella nasicola]|uniref:Shikimate kinase n=1 Tax=Bowdeniella nasicola TaxID=208480 RepID=A0A1Q5Q1Z4_9ACTO|nr:bifunctional shikimate kinase/3-dehydroquinate synthase [Bowdeniella nasicola]OKL53893.1 hypothetical protein BSZ39_07040 [Bowdeniella nasicola]
MSSVILVGMPGVGKTTVGTELASRLDLPFRDLDRIFEDVHRISPAEYIRTRGEDAFRVKEAELISRAVAGESAVIATGGGVVVDPVARWQLWNAGTIVWLDAPDHVLRNRFSADPDLRPLTQSAEQLAERRAQRLPYYRAADIHVDSTAQKERLATQIIDELRAREKIAVAERGRLLFKMETRRDHPMGPREATIAFADHLPATWLRSLIEEYSAGVPIVAADRNPAAGHPDLMSILPSERVYLMTAGEQNKRLASVESLLEFAAERRAERKDAWIALGGGTTGDLVGTAAALYQRGAPLIQMPTTWLAMADAAIGGKVAVDLSAAKNSAGAFWPPVAVIANTATLSTLPRDLLLDGMGETLKSGVIGDPWLFDLVERRGSAALDTDAPDLAARYAMIERSALLKIGVVERDPFEEGERRNLNLGHTIGHALEIESGYRLPHGRAVILGLRAVAAIARRRGADPAVAQRIEETAAELGFELTRRFDPAVVKDVLKSDKKSHRGAITWVLPMDIGEVVQVNDVTEAEIDAALAEIAQP